MITARYIKSPLITKLVLIFVVAFAGLFLSSVAILLCANYINNIVVMKWLQLVQTVFTFVLPAFLLAYLMGQGVTYLKFTSVRSPLIWLSVILLMPLALPAVNWLKSLNDMVVLPHFMSGVELWMQQMEHQSEVLTDKFLSVSSYSGLALNLLVMAAIPALGEELFFRGILQTVLGEKFNRHLAVWITAFIFSAIHLQFFGFIPRLFMGAILGYMFYYTKNLWVPILYHFVNNAAVVIMNLYWGDSQMIKNMEEGPLEWYSYIILIVSLLFTYLLFSSFAKNRGYGKSNTIDV